MVGATKFPVLDEAFLPKMIEKCDDDKERGLVYILYYTGMHGSCLCNLSLESLVREGDRTYLQWKRTKTKKTMRCLMKPDKLPTIKVFLESKKKTIQRYNEILKSIGEAAGFDKVSTMTFRHTRCIRALTEEGYSPWQVPHVMGCTPEVVARNYTKMHEDQLERQANKRVAQGLEE